MEDLDEAIERTAGAGISAKYGKKMRKRVASLGQSGEDRPSDAGSSISGQDLAQGAFGRAISPTPDSGSAAAAAALPSAVPNRDNWVTGAPEVAEDEGWQKQHVKHAKHAERAALPQPSTPGKESEPHVSPTGKGHRGDGERSGKVWALLNLLLCWLF